VDDGGSKDRAYSSVAFTLPAFVENLTLSGSAVIDATGNNLANTLVGNSAANILTGLGGNDTLTGGLGADTFMFGPADATSTDTVTDFAAEDWVGIKATDYGLGLGSGLVLDGSGALVLDPAYFATVSGSSLQGTATGHGQFVYNTTTRSLMWDADGAGTSTGIALATFNSGTVLTAADFAITPPPGVGNISISDVTITEGDAGTQIATFTVSRTGTAAFSVDFATADGTAATADNDYVATAGTLIFDAGQATATVSVTINGDTTLEPDETFFVYLTNATNGGNILDGQGQGTISNDEPLPPVVGDISIDDVTITEGDAGTKTASFTVRRTGTAAFAVDFATADGTATAADGDYIAAASTLNFDAGQATATVSVTIDGDTTQEPDETFFVDLTNATNGGNILDSQGQGTISDDDTPQPGVGDISIDDVTITEGDAGTQIAMFTVSRTGTAAFAVDFATADGTATGGDSDYVATAGTVNFAANQATATVSVTINGDRSLEPDETFFVNLTSATNGGTILDSQGQGTISNDEVAPPPLNMQVLHIHNTTVYDSGDPSGVAYVPSLTIGVYTGPVLFIADSEHDESPYFSQINLYAITPDGSFLDSYSLTSFTDEPTGLAYNPTNGLLYITDDDAREVFWVDPANPSVKLGQFDVGNLGIADAEDPKIDPVTGNIYMLDGQGSRTLYELSPTGALVRSFVLPTQITDAEGLAYDAEHDVFFIASGATRGAIFEIDGDGNLLATNTLLNDYLNPNGDTKPRIKGLELALSSDPDDGNHLGLYAVDYGLDQQNDGRVFEIDLGSGWLIA
jgi:hypothetical protein